MGGISLHPGGAGRKGEAFEGLIGLSGCLGVCVLSTQDKSLVSRWAGGWRPGEGTPSGKWGLGSSQAIRRGHCSASYTFPCCCVRAHGASPGA